MVPRFYKEYVTNTVGDGKSYKARYGVFYSEDPLIIAAAPVSITAFESVDAVAVDSCAFSDCVELTSVNLPSLRYIGEYAFYWCKELKEFSDMSQVLIMQGGAFCDTKLEHVDLSSLMNIPYGAFSDCLCLKSVKLCKNLRSIGEGAFGGCQKLEAITLPKSLNYIGSEAFFGTALREVSIPKGVKELKDGVFACCEQLSSIIIPDGSIERIESCALVGCKSLRRIYLPRSVKEIHAEAFIATPIETVICRKNSFAERWAREHGYTVEYRV